MFRSFLVFLGLGVGCGWGGDHCDSDSCEGETGVSGLVGDVERGAQVFAENCMRCHGQYGSGRELMPAMNLLMENSSDADLAEVIVEGTDHMPPQDLNEQEVADVIAYLRDLFE